jgi:hypothetical protein
LVSEYALIISFDFSPFYVVLNFVSSDHYKRGIEIMSTNTKFIVTAILALTIHTMSEAQFRMDVVGGYSPASQPRSAGIIVNRQLPHEEFVFNIIKADQQFHGGIKTQLELGAPFFLEAGLIYTKARTTYHLAYTLIDAEHPEPDYFKEETNHYLMLPVQIGVNLGMVDVMSGFRLMQSMNNQSELESMPGFQGTTSALRYGWQGSVGLNIMRCRVAIEYQGNFSRVGEGMKITGQSLELMNVPGQFVLLFQRSL